MHVFMFAWTRAHLKHSNALPRTKCAFIRFKVEISSGKTQQEISSWVFCSAFLLGCMYVEFCMHWRDICFHFIYYDCNKNKTNKKKIYIYMEKKKHFYSNCFMHAHHARNVLFMERFVDFCRCPFLPSYKMATNSNAINCCLVSSKHLKHNFFCFVFVVILSNLLKQISKYICLLVAICSSAAASICIFICVSDYAALSFNLIYLYSQIYPSVCYYLTCTIVGYEILANYST